MTVLSRSWHTSTHKVKLHGGAVVRSLEKGIKASSTDPSASHCLRVMVDAPDTSAALVWSRLRHYRPCLHATCVVTWSCRAVVVWLLYLS